jgi:hypothetical protein
VSTGAPRRPSTPADPAARPPRTLEGVPDRETEELSTDQLSLEAIERERARAAEQRAEERTHERRADKAAYLREKLDERADSEDDG